MIDESAPARPAVAPSAALEKGGASGPVYRWYALAVLFAAYVLASLDRSAVSVVAEALKHEFQLSDKQIGALGGLAFSTPYALAVLPMGMLIDRTNRTRLLGFIVTVWSVLTMVCALATGYLTLMLARMGVGAAEAGSTPASLSLIADTFPLTQRNTAISIYYSGTQFAQFVIFLLGGWLLLHYDWRAVFLIAGLPGLVIALMVFLTMKEPGRGVYDAVKAQNEAFAKLGFFRTIGAILKVAPLRYIIMATTLSSGVQYSLLVWMTSFFVRVHGLPIDKAAMWTGIGFGVGATIGSLVIGPIADRVSKGDTFRLAMIPAISTLVCFLTGLGLVLSPSLTVALVFLNLLSVGAGCFLGPGYAMAIGLAAPNMRGATISAIKLLAMLIGSGLIPLYTGAISDAIGGPNSLAIAMAATVVLHLVAAIFFFMAGHRARQAERAAG